MKLENHYYSIMAGVAGSFASFFGKMMTFTGGIVFTVSKCCTNVSCFIVASRIDVVCDAKPCYISRKNI